jgi:hypothetical protein
MRTDDYIVAIGDAAAVVTPQHVLFMPAFERGLPRLGAAIAAEASPGPIGQGIVSGEYRLCKLQQSFAYDFRREHLCPLCPLYQACGQAEGFPHIGAYPAIHRVKLMAMIEVELLAVQSAGAWLPGM